MYKYNICFIKRGSKILLINRESAPLKGLWNGVGGKLEANETIIQSVYREVWEETGIHLTEVIDKGVVTWEVDGSSAGGMYLFIADIPEDFTFETPKQMDEGILDWKEMDWILDRNNQGIVPHVSYYLESLFLNNEKHEYKCVYQDGKLVNFEIMPLAVTSM